MTSGERIIMNLKRKKISDTEKTFTPGGDHISY